MCYLLTARKNQCLVVTDRQMEILAGTIIGDGYITQRGAFQIEHTLKQKEYIDWKYQELQSLTSVKPKNVKRKTSASRRFVLRQYFRPLRHLVYHSGKKMISDKLLEYFSPLSLAVWYMDDGCLRNNYQAILCTDGFSDRSIERLRNYLEKQWLIRTRIKLKRERDGRVYRRLTIGSFDLVRFFEIIRPYIIPSMQYKISDPVTTRSIKRRNRWG